MVDECEKIRCDVIRIFSEFIKMMSSFQMAGYEELFKVKHLEESKKTLQREVLKIDMNMFKSIWGLMLGI